MPATAAPPDLLGLRLTHRAMRADLHRLSRLAGRLADGQTACRRRRAAAIARYVSRLCDSIDRHHQVEDRHLWPILDAAAGAEIDLAELSDDHAALEPLLDQVRAAAAGFARDPAGDGVARRLAYTLGALRDLLDEHIVEEERTILPVIERYVSAAEWSVVEAAARADGGLWFDLPRIDRFAQPAERAQLYAAGGPVLRVLLAVARPLYRRRERVIF